MKRISTLAAALFAASVTMTSPASATTITSLSGGTAVPISAVNRKSTTATQTMAAGITADPRTSFTYGWTDNYYFEPNGQWSPGTPMIGLDLADGSFDINFANPITAFLAQVNWGGYSLKNATMAAYNSTGLLLESLTLESGGVNQVAPGYHGFSRSAGDIATVRFSNEFIAIRKITIISNATGAVPEPATWAMMIVGFGMVGASMRRRKISVRYA